MIEDRVTQAQASTARRLSNKAIPQTFPFTNYGLREAYERGYIDEKGNPT